MVHKETGDGSLSPSAGCQFFRETENRPLSLARLNTAVGMTADMRCDVRQLFPKNLVVSVHHVVESMFPVHSHQRHALAAAQNPVLKLVYSSCANTFFHRYIHSKPVKECSLQGSVKSFLQIQVFCNKTVLVEDERQILLFGLLTAALPENRQICQWHLAKTGVHFTVDRAVFLWLLRQSAIVHNGQFTVKPFPGFEPA